MFQLVLYRWPVNVVHHVLCALAKFWRRCVASPDVLIFGRAPSEKNSWVTKLSGPGGLLGNVDETEVSSGFSKKAQGTPGDGQRNITLCWNEVGTFGTKDEEVTAEMDKKLGGQRSEQVLAALLALGNMLRRERKLL
ncbi:hypothetical protein TNIN_268341 [Trichonephila inaurata madagascariensis]|uniref:Uncharacterized protein n=1 Tax=Trichonephila inaurata madagascariensis TaxID=2747483 RepID=A0A8X7C7G9_9ARAC|nr:hypothetical protein TNIN_268341 [Trichonephila inaurata madagascariensis]